MVYTPILYTVRGHLLAGLMAVRRFASEHNDVHIARAMHTPDGSRLDVAAGARPAQEHDTAGCFQRGPSLGWQPILKARVQPVTAVQGDVGRRQQRNQSSLAFACNQRDGARSSDPGVGPGDPDPD